MTGYTCLRCQLRRLRQPSTPAPLSTTGNLQAILRLSNQRTRLYATATDAPHNETSPESTIGAAFPYNAFNHSLNAHPPEGHPALQTESALRGTPSIRDHLRKWSLEHVKRRQVEFGDDIPEFGQIRQLPNSLFLEEQTEATIEAEDDEADTDNFDEMTEGAHRNAMSPGDLCYLKPALGKQQFGVFVGQAGVQLLYILESGRFCQMNLNPETFATEPGFITQEEAEAIRVGLPKQHIMRSTQGERLASFGLFQGDAPQSVRALCEDLATRMRHFRNEVVAFRRSHVELLDTLYERMAQEDDYVSVPLNQFYAKLLGSRQAELSAAGRMAIYLMAHANPTKIQLWHGQQNTNVKVLFGPKSLTRRLDKVVDWAREYQELAALASKGQNVQLLLRQNPVNQFINKARMIITESRRLRSPTTIGCLGPSKQGERVDGKITKRILGTAFSESDVSVIDFIHDTYVRRPFKRGSTAHHAIASLILRGIGAYPKMTLEHTIGRLLLQELGVMMPWAEPFEDSVNFPIPRRRGAERFTRLYAEAERSAASLGFREGVKDIPLPDPFADVRKDLGAMPVYVIDGAETDVHDDGVSFEDSEEQPGCYWVHVHVAHPSAFLEPNSILGQVARTQCNSWYTKATTYPMLPEVVGKAFSLRAGSPTLTTSTLLDENGKVVDIRVRPTRIHNIIELRPKGISELLGKSEPDSTILVVGDDPAIHVQPPRAVLDEEIAMARPHMPVLSTAHRRLLARHKMRQQVQKETVDFPYQDLRVNVDVNKQQVFQSSGLHESVHYVGDPTIRIAVPKRPWVGRWSDQAFEWDLVQHCMVLAGESAGKWLADRRMPAVYSGSLADPEFPLWKLNASTRSSNFLTPKAVMRAEPVPHVIMTLSQYSRTTSPIRRVDDLITQWNIDSYLQAEAQGLVHNGAPLPETHNFPFSADAIMEHIRVNGWIAGAGRRQHAASQKHWSFQALFRAFHFKEAELPEIWYMQAQSTRIVSHDIHPTGQAVAGRLAPFGHACTLVASENDWDLMAQRGQYLPVKIERVDATSLHVYVEAVGPPVDELQEETPGNTHLLSKQRRDAMERAAKEHRSAAGAETAA